MSPIYFSILCRAHMLACFSYPLSPFLCLFFVVYRIIAPLLEPPYILIETPIENVNQRWLTYITRKLIANYVVIFQIAKTNTWRVNIGKRMDTAKRLLPICICIVQNLVISVVSKEYSIEVSASNHSLRCHTTFDWLDQNIEPMNFRVKTRHYEKGLL